MALLEVDGIVAGYVPGLDILNGLRLRLEPGTITGIIGPNGAGKSTLLKTIFGFLRPRQGSITFAGRPIQGLSPHTIKRLGIGYAPQGTNIFAQLTVHENLQLGAWVYRRQGRRVAELLERAYTAFPRLRQKRRRRATSLSGGEAKMLSLAKEQVTEPTLLLVDEPSAGHGPTPHPAGLCPAPAGAGPGRDHPAGGSKHRQSRRDLRLPLHARYGAGAA